MITDEKYDPDLDLEAEIEAFLGQGGNREYFPKRILKIFKVIEHNFQICR